MGKIRKTFLIMIGTILVWSHLPYHYNNEKVAAYATAHAAGGSRCMCTSYIVFVYNVLSHRVDSSICIRKDVTTNGVL